MADGAVWMSRPSYRGTDRSYLGCLGVQVSVQPLPSAAEDEILGADLQAVPAPPGGRHRRKKLCIGMTVVLLLALVVFKGMAAGDEAADSSAMAAPEMLVAPAGGGETESPPEASAGEDAPTGAASSNATRLLQEMRESGASATFWPEPVQA